MNIFGKKKPLRLLIAFPRYRFLWASAEDFQCDLILAASQTKGEIVLGRYPAKSLTGLHVETARERACAYGVEKGFDVVLMGDADVGLDGAEGLTLAREAVAGDFAVLAVPYPARGADDWPNFAPFERDDRTTQTPTDEETRALAAAVRDGLVYELPRGYLGTGVAAFSTKALAQIPRPWFFRPMEEDDAEKRGITGRTTEDVFFCRRARAAGQRIGLHFGLRSGVHWDAHGRRSATMLAAISRQLQEEIRRSGGPEA